MAWRGPASKTVTNAAPNPVSHGNEMSGMTKTLPDAGIPFKEHRALDMRRDKDEQKDFSVKLIDVDTTILSYLDNVISPSIKDAGRVIKVPINYASPERWKAIRKDGAIRDHNGKVQCPAIAFRRTTMQRNDSLITLNRYLQYPTIKHFSEKNKYDKFSLMNGFSHVKELYSVAMPDHVIINYDFIVWTDLVEQGNEIVEGINFSTEDYWGDKNRYKFRTSISDYNFETTVDAGSDRIVKTTFSLMVYAYLLPDRYENYKSVVQKAFTERKIVFNVEVSVDNVQNLPPDELQKLSISGDASTLPPRFSGIMQNVDHALTADYATIAAEANSALTASYLDISNGQSTTLASLNLVGGNTTGSMGTHVVTGLSTPQSIDSIPVSTGNSATWLVSIHDSTNYKTSEVVAAWNSTTGISFYVTEVSQIGLVPVTLTVTNSGGNVTLTATPASGTWTIKLIRMVV